MKKNIFGMTVKYEKADISSQGLLGQFDPMKKTITIDKTLKGDAYKQTKLHEEFEAVYYRIAGHQFCMSNDAKESMIDSFATFVVENYHLKPK